MERENFGKFIKQMREERNITREELAKKIGTTKQGLILIEAGFGANMLVEIFKLGQIFSDINLEKR